MREPNPWDQVFIAMAHVIATRSKDPSTTCGAVLVSETNIVLSTGFNGPPANMVDNAIPWEDRPQKYTYIIHAEENALLFALSSHGGGPLHRSRMYVTHKPCSECILRMIRAHVGEVIYPETASDYKMSKWNVDIDEIIEKQVFPKIRVRTTKFA